MSDSGGLGRSDVARCWAGFASLGAGLVHLAVVHEHAQQWWLYGAFFAVAGSAQILWALGALGRDRPPFVRLVAASNLGLVALWAVTRVTGLPFGPEPRTAEAAGRADVLCVALEVVTVLCLLAAVRSARPSPTSGQPAVPSRRAVGRFVALMFAGALAVSAITTPALAATEAGGHARHHVE